MVQLHLAWRMVTSENWHLPHCSHNENIAEPINKVFSTGLIVEDISSLNSPTYDVMQNSGGVYTARRSIIFINHKDRKKKSIIS